MRQLSYGNKELKTLILACDKIKSRKYFENVIARF